MQTVEPAAAPSYVYQQRKIREGTEDSKLLAEGVEDTPHMYRVMLSRAETDWNAPRHHHNFDQVRYTVRGKFVESKDHVLPVGWVSYIPEGVYYGPQFREPDSIIYNCQFGGSSGGGNISKRQRDAAFDELSKRGFFEKGSFTWLDEKGGRHREDSFEAIWEQAFGRKIEYPQPRYQGIITMNPDTFAWTSVADSPGVSNKLLGVFTERKTEVGFIGIEPGATFAAGLHDAPQILFLTKGSVRCVDRLFPLHSAFSFEAMEGPVSIQAVEPSELLYVHLPKF
jgi:hypothetical protein